MGAKLVFHPSSRHCSQSRRRKKKQGTRGCTLKDSAVDFMKHIAQAVSTLRKRRGKKRKKRKKHQPSYNNHFNSNNCWISAGNKLPRSTFTLKKGGGGEGKGVPTHLRNQIQKGQDRVIYALTLSKWP